MEIFKAIPAIMKDIDPIAKTKTNSQGSGYKFRGIDDVYQACQQVLAKHGVFTVPRVLKDESEERQSKSGGTLIYRKLLIEYTFYAGDGSSVSSIVMGEGMDSGDKASNKAMSVAHKYALLQVFCIPTDEPKDPEHETPEVTATKPAKPVFPVKSDKKAEPTLSAANNCISEKQRKRLFAISTGKGWTENELRECLRLGWSISTTKEIHWGDYDGICKMVEHESPTAAMKRLHEEHARAGQDMAASQMSYGPPLTDADVPF